MWTETEETTHSSFLFSSCLSQSLMLNFASSEKRDGDRCVQLPEVLGIDGLGLDV